MNDILHRILQTKKEEVLHARAACPLSELRGRIADLPPPRDFVGAIQAKVSAVGMASASGN